ncbi:MAG: nucleoside transporter C-terminal domain-containing protein [bacterium]
MIHRLAALIGFVVIVFIAFILCNNKRRINPRTFFWGITLQFIFAFMVLRGADIMSFMGVFLPGRGRYYTIFLLLQIVAFFFIGRAFKTKEASTEMGMLWFKRVMLFEGLIIMLRWNLLEKFFVGAREVVTRIISFSVEGATFVFGSLATDNKPVGFIFAFGVLPTIIFVASIFAIMYYYGIMQVVVRSFARLMVRIMGTSGAESTSVAASIFMGQTEAPLTIRPFLSKMTMSELMTVMTAGMAHVSGGIMAAYVMVAHVDIMHLLTAVIMTAPGSIFMSKMMVPEVGKPETGEDVEVDVEVHDVNVIDAAARGASEGGILALNVVGMLIAFIALVALVNGCLGGVHQILETLLSKCQAANVLWIQPALQGLVNYFPSSLQQILGWIFSPLAFVMGVPWKDAATVGNLMGIRMVLNEFVAFAQLGPLRDSLDPRSFVIATYALCGFANFSSVAIQIGGIGALAPDRRHDLAKLGIKAMLAGTLANFLTATIAGILL